MIKKMTAIAAVSAAAVVLFTPSASAITRPGTTAAPADHVVSSVGTAVPDHAQRTLSLIDAGQWPPHDNSGTRGGEAWPNRDGVLPGVDADGNPIHYLQWDVNRKQPGHPRDSERIVTGTDGSAWYTGDRLLTFTRMR
ncbi:ribonuclease domain-containing protein [Streptomyces sp. NPDC052109]|uniref:ribonuclease domain-containing protein n=1 Tax=Streptomyces sp. NPDC052109 TaxID=3155527 RepID=UPI00341CC70B